MDVEKRKMIVDSAIASQRLEGLDLDKESLADLRAYVDGGLTIDDVESRALARFMRRPARRR